MNVGVFTICHNEKTFLPYFFRHYKAFANFIAVIDNNSTDGSFEICLQESNSVEKIDTGNLHKIELMTELKNNYWKKFKNLDWIFIVDVDEIIYHPNMLKFLEEAKKQGYTVLQPTGYQMICDDFPVSEKTITEAMPYGVLSTPEISMSLFSCDNFNKQCVIAPSQISETNYKFGAHDAEMTGNVKNLCDPKLKLLHYRLLGLDYFLNKNKMRTRRLIPEFTDKGFSIHYLKPEEELSLMFNDLLKKRENIC